ncbi:MAG: glutamate synthase large subunit [Erysipelotrichaceae bacterium]|nr:glutamate synthase large subunit [Erysipelotrichaceae bacterium]MDD3809915.1 glutamate synthase large subunit [Erysipelotrichaceae bacterium]
MENSLYDPSFEHDNCGIGAVVNIKGVKTHKTVSDALTIVEQLEHRAGKDADGKTGDGVGILTQIPHEYFANLDLGFKLPDEGEYGVAMLFLPQESLIRNRVIKHFEMVVENEKLEILGWRDAPTAPKVLGRKALEAMPYIAQCFVAKPKQLQKGLDFDRRLYEVRRLFEHSAFDDTYICSFSSRTIVYKGMFLVGQLRSFFKDLQSKQYKSAVALVHSRFSTNTNPSWKRAHPNRIIVHNGEINTIKGNANNMFSREENMATTNVDTNKVYPVVDLSGSDSARLDNTLEFLVMAGMPLPRAVMMTIPEPHENNKAMDPKKRAMYEYHATIMEPWDGPASILFSDGEVMGAILDRNGLRPSRYYITKDGYLVLSSEVGALSIDEKDVELKDRLRPGKMLLVDTVAGRLISDDEIKSEYAAKAPYGEWLERQLVKLEDLKIPNKKPESYTGDDLKRRQKVFGYSYEDVNDYIRPVALSANETVIAMGTDAPLAVFSKKHPPLFNYFKQLFAQVTNPPIDAIREEIVTSSTLYLGCEGNMLEDKAENCRLLKIHNPILSNVDMLKIRGFNKSGFKVETVTTTYIKNTSLEQAIEKVCNLVDKAYHKGANIIILSDREIDEYHMPIPSLLITAAVNQHLVNTKKRNSVALVVESGEPREVHHFATLLGYGASAINPYLAQDTITEMVNEGTIDKDATAAIEDYNDAIIHGIIKIASKMGISTIQSYRGSQNFEAIGLSSSLINKYFKGTVSRVEGNDIEDIEKDVEYRHNKVYDPLGLAVDASLDSSGELNERAGKEIHLYKPETIYLLQQATRTGDYNLFKQYANLINKEGESLNLRGQLRFKKTEAISIDEVEPVDSIVTRFKTGAMSYGSISKEAHECMAIAMNRLKGRSNSGEGGEDEERFTPLPNGDSRCSAIKQVASGRFGVTSKYLNSAQEIQIKMAQGAKPGEGGQLPAMKVYPWVAKTRHSTPGVDLISPPPHHDIYSIEDLAQLIYDLKNANTQARISVKLVSEAGVGTIAAGVAKAGAEVILISGYDGGTGAAPKNSVFNAGLPWELGLVEAHQNLIENDLRKRVIIETDGKLMTGRDLAIAALLGAQEYGFATVPLITMGCIMMRVCNLDTCPVGVATQNPELRKRFTGKPEYVENFMRFVAQDMREVMAELGFRTIDEMVGRVDLLEASEDCPIDLARVLNPEFAKAENLKFDPKMVYDFKLDEVKDNTVLMKKFKLDNKAQAQTLEMDVNNLDRSFGTIFGSQLTKKYGETLADDTFVIKAKGSVGQSCGAFIPKGLTIAITGDTNDYLGKGLSGGKIIVKTPAEATFKAEENIIIGNVCFFGATSGEAYVNGVAGERFCVRNSGVHAVVEGVGDHGCEYMTGGLVAVLGKTGRNFAAGMSGGIAYVYDQDNTFYQNVNPALVSYDPVSSKYDKEQLKTLIEKHYEATGSKVAKDILDDFENQAGKFKKVIPGVYQKMVELIKKYEHLGLTGEQARIEAFNEVKKGVNNG